MDYEEFNKEYNKYEMWNEKENEFSESIDKLIWGSDKIDIKDALAKNPTRPRNAIQPTGFIPDDRVNSPSHYTSGRMESIDIIEDAIQVAPTPKEGFLQGQVLKYILRVWLKDNPLEDLKKARWYLDRLIKSLE